RQCQEAEVAWQQLQTHLHPNVVHAPRLIWSQVHPRMLLYLFHEVREHPWLNHLALLTGILTSYTKQDIHTIEGKIYALHARFREIFPRFQISSLVDWQPDIHFPRYFEDVELADTSMMRSTFLSYYNTSVRYSTVYLRSLPKTEQDR